ncbi:MAG: DUF3048 domain-containing protein [bacterium]|nr:DUF3048 domain-containing protein [bacterium]
MGGNPLRRFIHEWQTNSHVRLSVIAALLVAGAGFVWLGVFIAIKNQRGQTVTTPQVHKIDIDMESVEDIDTDLNEDIVPRLVDGVLVDADYAYMQPIGIMIENAAFGGVRPQDGLNSAQIVYELVVEGGITRLMAIFASNEMPEKIGPVRSARPTFLEFISEFDGLYGHAGGSPESLQAIDGLQIKDLSALGADSRFFYRDSTRVAPHNLFTSDELLNLAKRDKTLDNQEIKFDVWNFKEDEKKDSAFEEEKYIHIDFGSGPLYEVKYIYNYEQNSYERYNGGEPHKDANDDKIIMAKNVVVQIVPPAIPAGEKGRVNFDVTGSGDAYIAIDGKVSEAKWEKPDRLSRIQFYTLDDELIEFNRGTTWISILPETGSVDYN